MQAYDFKVIDAARYNKKANKAIPHLHLQAQCIQRQQASNLLHTS
jgi:hypothetical protein